MDGTANVIHLRRLFENTTFHFGAFHFLMALPPEPPLGDFKPQQGVYPFPNKTKTSSVSKHSVGITLNAELKPVADWMHVEPPSATPIVGKSRFHMALEEPDCDPLETELEVQLICIQIALWFYSHPSY